MVTLRYIIGFIIAVILIGPILVIVMASVIGLVVALGLLAVLAFIIPKKEVSYHV